MDELDKIVTLIYCEKTAAESFSPSRQFFTGLLCCGMANTCAYDNASVQSLFLQKVDFNMFVINRIPCTK